MKKKFRFVEYGKQFHDYGATDFVILSASDQEISKSADYFRRQILLLPVKTHFTQMTGSVSFALLNLTDEEYLFVQIQSRKEDDLNPNAANHRPYNQIRFTYLNKIQICNNIGNNYALYDAISIKNKDILRENSYYLNDYLQSSKEMRFDQYEVDLIEMKNMQKALPKDIQSQLNREIKIVFELLYYSFLGQSHNTRISLVVQVNIENNRNINNQYKLIFINILQKEIFNFWGERIISYAFDYITDHYVDIQFVDDHIPDGIKVAENNYLDLKNIEINDFHLLDLLRSIEKNYIDQDVIQFYLNNKVSLENIIDLLYIIKGKWVNERNFSKHFAGIKEYLDLLTLNQKYFYETVRILPEDKISSFTRELNINYLLAKDYLVDKDFIDLVIDYLDFKNIEEYKKLLAELLTKDFLTEINNAPKRIMHFLQKGNSLINKPLILSSGEIKNHLLSLGRHLSIKSINFAQWWFFSEVAYCEQSVIEEEYEFFRNNISFDENSFGTSNELFCLFSNNETDKELNLHTICKDFYSPYKMNRNLFNSLVNIWLSLGKSISIQDIEYLIKALQDKGNDLHEINNLLGKIIITKGSCGRINEINSDLAVYWMQTTRNIDLRKFYINDSKDFLLNCLIFIENPDGNFLKELLIFENNYPIAYQEICKFWQNRINSSTNFSYEEIFVSYFEFIFELNKESFDISERIDIYNLAKYKNNDKELVRNLEEDSLEYYYGLVLSANTPNIKYYAIRLIKDYLSSDELGNRIHLLEDVNTIMFLLRFCIEEQVNKKNLEIFFQEVFNRGKTFELLNTKRDLITGLLNNGIILDKNTISHYLLVKIPSLESRINQLNDSAIYALLNFIGDNSEFSKEKQLLSNQIISKNNSNEKNQTKTLINDENFKNSINEYSFHDNQRSKEITKPIKPKKKKIRTYLDKSISFKLWNIILLSIIIIILVIALIYNIIINFSFL